MKNLKIPAMLLILDVEFPVLLLIHKEHIPIDHKSLLRDFLNSDRKLYLLQCKLLTTVSVQGRQ